MSEIFRSILDWRTMTVAVIVAVGLSMAMTIIAEGASGHGALIKENQELISEQQRQMEQLASQLERMEHILSQHMEDCARRHKERGYK